MDNNLLELSVVLPCLNEEGTIGICLKKIKDVFSKCNIKGEIVVVDNGSVDRSAQIAESEGARVISETKRGYGAAYLRGLKEARGRYLIIADSDNTYDFYDIPEFLGKLREGYDFVMGSRFRGKIHKNAMPWLNRYIGNPILSGMCRIFFRTKLSDIHCGMRAFTRQAYDKMRLMSEGMEFATEMVVVALQNNLKICEIPIDYHMRAGESKLKPFYDAWRHIRFMLLYCPVWLYFVPGLLGFISGMGILFLLLRGPFLFLGRLWDIHMMIFASMISILSYQVLNLGTYAHTFAVKQGLLKEDNFILFLKQHFSLEKGLLIGALFLLVGGGINLFIFLEWFSRSFGTLYRIRESIFAMTLLIIGLQTIFSSFFVSLLFIQRK